MDARNENNNYDAIEGLRRSMRQWVEKHRENETLEHMDEWRKKDDERHILH